MYCDHCGAQLQEGQGFCHSCGKAFQAAAPARTAGNRVSRHATTLGIVWVVWSLLHLFPAVGAMFIGSVGLPFFHRASMHPFFMGPLVTIFGGIMGICAILGIVAGWGLLSCQSWARVLLLILACVALLNIPIGTAIGAYTLWVLLSRDSEQEFNRMVAARS